MKVTESNPAFNKWQLGKWVINDRWSLFSISEGQVRAGPCSLLTPSNIHRTDLQNQHQGAITLDKELLPKSTWSSFMAPYSVIGGKSANTTISWTNNSLIQIDFKAWSALFESQIYRKPWLMQDKSLRFRFLDSNYQAWIWAKVCWIIYGHKCKHLRRPANSFHNDCW